MVRLLKNRFDIQYDPKIEGKWADSEEEGEALDFCVFATTAFDSFKIIILKMGGGAWRYLFLLL